MGFSLFVRTSEAVWVGILFFVCLFWIGKRFGWFRIVVAIFGVILVLIPLLLFNRSLYSNLFATGYTVGIADEQASIVSIPVSPQTQDRSLVEIAPFGIHPRIAWMNVRLYGIELFWWISVLVLLGIPLIFTKNGEQNVSWHARGAYLFLFLFVAGWLALMYGSWTIHDNPDPSVVTIGNSYIRYWLPIFVMTTPFVALAVQWICRRARTQFARRFAYGCMMLLLFGLGMRAAFFAPQDGLVAMRERLVTYTAIRDRVFILTEPDAVFIVDRADKLFFPERRIRYPLRDEKTYALLPDIASRAPLYYYGITLPEVDVNYLNTEKLPPLGLRIEHRETFGQESLYHFVLFHP
ncbi:MAG: hypothetical protein UU31_C0004G0014 [Candidatus Uhrbacteria bacterium GW2011_GWA2_41_10]|nr:MAG: hypothetical protein UU31_C0004G0014 [Candidatus Uhrbacteria bacterium GW2011_GWA2_41_10]